MERATCDFRADVSLDPNLFHCHVKTRRAVDAISVEQCHGGHIQTSADSCQILRQGRAFEEAESRAGVKFDVHQWSVSRCQLKTAFWFSGPRRLATDHCFSVIRTFHEPASAEQIVNQAVESNIVCVLQSNVPFIAGPGFPLPPVAGTTPGAGLPEHTSVYFFSLRAGHPGQFSIF